MERKAVHLTRIIMPDEPKYPKLRKAALFAAAMAGAFLAGLLGKPDIIPNAPPPEPPAEAAPPNAFGWFEDRDEVDAVLTELPQPVFADTPAGRDQDPLPQHVYLWEAHRKITGQNPPPQDQNPVGSCVSFGSSRAYERSLAVQIVKGDAFEFRHLVEESIYALSRVEIGGGRIRGDGSVGAWAAKGFTQFGGLPRGQYLNGKYDLTKYSPSRCRDWGYRGLPDDLEPEAKRFPAGSATLIRSWDEAKRALANGYGIAICSNQGFTRQRDSNGVCRASGAWAHCMACDGFHVDPATGREYGHIENSWGPDYHVGPTGWGSPSTAGFWAESSVIDRMLKQGDSWAFSAVKGFPVQRVDWDIFGAAPARRLQRDIRPAELLALAW